MKRYVLALDLKDDEHLIQKYEDHHRRVWPEIIRSIKDSGIIDMKIYRTGNRLCMIMDTSEDFSFARKEAMDQSNVKVQEWETLMDRFQQRLPWAGTDEKWVIMEELFDLNARE